MKNKLLAVLAIFGMVASASAVKINNNLSINGFIDGSYSNTDNGSAAAADEKNQDIGVDEVELDFVVNVGNVSGLVALDNDADDDDSFAIEQAHFTYNINDAVSVTFGRFGSALGLEREDPAGLYTFSRAYSDAYLNAGGGATGTNNQGSEFNFGNIDRDNEAQRDGVKISYSASAYTLALALSNQSDEKSGLQTDDLDAEISFSYTGLENTVIGGGYRIDNSQATVDTETDALNLYITRQFGKLLLGFEYSELDVNGNSVAGQTDDERDAYLVLADYDFNDKLGVALRVSSTEKTNNGGDVDRVTIAPNYAITDSLGAILEYSDIDDAGNDIEEYAVELTYTF